MTDILSEQDYKASADNWLLVSEIFESHQGEGRSSGEVAKFLRLGGCNLTCRWCDTPYTWLFTERQLRQHNGDKIYDSKHELRRWSFIEILRKLDSLRKPSKDIHPLIVVTGGEPLLQAERLTGLIRLINAGLTFRRFEIETAGTIAPGELARSRYDNISFNVSLKLASSGNSIEKRRVAEAILALANCKSTFKFVVTREHFAEDLAEIEQIRQEYSLYPDSIWLMPEGTTQLDQVSGIQALMPEALKRGYNVSSRLHVLAYGNERGI